MTKKSLKKKIENPELRGGVSACQVVFDWKLNEEHDERIHFTPKPRELPQV